MGRTTPGLPLDALNFCNRNAISDGQVAAAASCYERLSIDLWDLKSRRYYRYYRYIPYDCVRRPLHGQVIYILSVEFDHLAFEMYEITSSCCCVCFVSIYVPFRFSFFISFPGRLSSS
jgi:hypothetical protein